MVGFILPYSNVRKTVKRFVFYKTVSSQFKRGKHISYIRKKQKNYGLGVLDWDHFQLVLSG